jgi:hypothetical protein
LHTIFSKFAIIRYFCIVLFCIGSSIKAARSSNRHTLALKADFKLFKEVLQPLNKTKPLSKSLDIDMSKNATEDDEDNPAKEQLFINLWNKFSYSICYVLIFTICFHLSTFFLVLNIMSSNCLYAI